MRPPRCIDGALVLEWAWSDVPFGRVHFEDGTVAATIHGLALCRYEGGQEIHRFSCNHEWETEQDGVYPSVEDAKAQLPQQYQGSPVRWTKA